MIPFLTFTFISLVVLRLGFRWPYRRVFLIAVVIGLAADALADLLLTRNH